MPCYSTIQTSLADAEALKDLGEAFEVRVFGDNQVVIRKGYAALTLRRYAKTEKFSASGDTEILDEVVSAYAKNKVKAFAKKHNYTVARGNTANEFVLTSYKG